MANPITWRNLNDASDYNTAARLFDSAGNNLQGAFSGLQNLLSAHQQLQAKNLDTERTNATNDFLNKVGSMSIDELQQARASGGIESLRKAYGVMLDQDKTNNNAMQSLLTGKRNDVIAEQGYADNQALRLDRPHIAAFTQAQTMGDVAGMEAAIKSMTTDNQVKFLLQMNEFMDGKLGADANKAIFNRDYAGAQQYLTALQNQGIDTTPYLDRIKGQQKEDSYTSLFNNVSTIPNQVQDMLKQEATSYAGYAESLGIPVNKDGSVDLSQVTDPAVLEKLGKYVQSPRDSNYASIKNSFNQKLAQHFKQFGYDPALANQMNLMIEQGLSAPSLPTQEQARLAAEDSREFADLRARGNFFLQKGDTYQPDPDGLSKITEMINKAPEGSQLADMDGSERKDLVTQVSKAMTSGIEIQGKKVPIPYELAQLALTAVQDKNFGMLRDGGNIEFSEVIKSVMDSSELGQQYKDYLEAHKHKEQRYSDTVKGYNLGDPGQRIRELSRIHNKLDELKQPKTPKAPAKDAEDTEAALKLLQDAASSSEQPSGKKPWWFRGNLEQYDAIALELEKQKQAEARMKKLEQDLKDKMYAQKEKNRKWKNYVNN